MRVHEFMVTLVHLIMALVGGTLMLMAMTSIVQENRPDGSVLVTLAMAALFLFGVAGLTGNIPW